jgi:hypothetical protein
MYQHYGPLGREAVKSGTETATFLSSFQLPSFQCFILKTETPVSSEALSQTSAIKSLRRGISGGLFSNMVMNLWVPFEAGSLEIS